MHTNRSIFTQFLRRNALLLAGTLVALLLSNLLNVLLPLSIGIFYDVVLQAHSTKGEMLRWLPVHLTDASSFMWFFGILIAIKAIFTFIEQYCTSLAGERFLRSIREQMFLGHLNFSLVSHQRRSVSKYLLRYTGELQTVRNLLTRGFLGFFGDVFFVLCAFGVLFWLSPVLALVAIGSLGMAGVIMVFLSKPVRDAADTRRRQRARNVSFIQERLQAFYTIKSFNRETPEGNQYKKQSEKLFGSSLWVARWNAFTQALFPVFFFGTIGLVMVTVVYLRGHEGSLNDSSVFVFVLLLLYMRSVTRRLLRVSLVWQAGWRSLAKIAKMLNLPSESRQKSASDEVIEPVETTSVIPSGLLKVEHLQFGYDSKQPPLINDFSATFQPHSISVVKGPLGAGKSTLLKLLQRMYPFQNGAIYLDGVDYRNLTPFEIRKQITIVSDATPLLGATVFEAITYNQTPEKRARAALLLEQLEIAPPGEADRWLDMNIAQEPDKLSKGDRLMLQLARALLTRKKIILLDEPFQHLGETQRRMVCRRLNKIRKNRTIILASLSVPGGLEVDQTILLNQPDLSHHA